jgi:site-specific DNA recombinase
MKRSNAGGGRPFSRGHLYRILSNPIYLGKIAHKGDIHPGQHPPIIDHDTWDQVQATLADNRQGQRTRANSTSPSLLAGLIADPDGRRYSAVHATKGTRRYRYYVLPKCEGTLEPEPKSLRWPGQELEAAVLDTVISGLRNRSGLLDALTNERQGDNHLQPNASIIQHCQQEAHRISGMLENGTVTQRIELIRRIIGTVTVSSEAIQITLRLDAMLGASGDDSLRGRVMHVERPVTLKRCGMAVRLLIPGANQRSTRADSRLVSLLAQASEWRERLTSGRSNSVLAIAREASVSSVRVARILHLSCLAPDIVDSILRGEQPLGLGPDKLIRSVPLPMDWIEQQRLLGFPTS